MSRETTFERDLHAVADRAELGAAFTELAEEVARDLQSSGYMGRTIGIKLRYADFRIVTRVQTIEHFVNDARTIRHVAGQCLKRVDLSHRLRLLGVRVGTLVHADDVAAFDPKPLQSESLALFSDVEESAGRAPQSTIAE